MNDFDNWLLTNREEKLDEYTKRALKESIEYDLYEDDYNDEEE